MASESKDFRYERKFIVPELSLHETESVIKHHHLMFSEIFHKRQVNNIYFDSVDFENYKDNMAGVAERMKIRIRWYGEMFGVVRNPVLELKIKRGELGKKVSFQLKDFVLDGGFSYKQLQKEVFEKSDLPGWLIVKLKFVQPSLLSSYSRKYFLSANKKYRVTIDDNLVFFRIREGNNSFMEKLVDRERIILEVKYPQEHSDEVASLTNMFPFRLSASSKYVYGLDLLDL